MDFYRPYLVKVNILNPPGSFFKEPDKTKRINTEASEVLFKDKTIPFVLSCMFNLYSRGCFGFETTEKRTKKGKEILYVKCLSDNLKYEIIVYFKKERVSKKNLKVLKNVLILNLSIGSFRGNFNSSWFNSHLVEKEN